MAKPVELTIIDNDILRGIVAPAKSLSKKLLYDVIDFIALSSQESAKETDERITEADQDNSWQTLDDVKNS